VETRDIDGFWGWFKKNSRRLRRIRSADDIAFTELEKLINGISSDIGIEIGGSEDSDTMSLILTAYGVTSVFPLVDAIASRAPKIPGWQIVALKPPLLEEMEVDYEGTVVKVSDLWVLPGDTLPDGVIPIQIAITAPPQPEGDENREAAALLALESFLGERAFASLIQVVGFVRPPAQLPVNGFIQPGAFAERLGLHRIQ